MKKVLGLNNKLIFEPYAYCKIKKCFITQDQYHKQQCYQKKCCHLKILSASDNINDFKTQPYNEAEWIKYRFTDRPCIQQDISYENHFKKRSFSSVPKLKEKLKEQHKCSWYSDLEKYYQYKYS